MPGSITENGNYCLFWKHRDYSMQVDFLKLLLRLSFIIIINLHFKIYLPQGGTFPLKLYMFQYKNTSCNGL